MRALTRSFSLICALGLSAGAYAERYDLEALTEQAREIQMQAVTAPTFEIPKNQYEAQGREVANQIMQAMRDNPDINKLMTPPDTQEDPSKVLFFASLSLGEEGLNDILYTAANTPDSAVVFRGLVTTDNFVQSIMHLQQLAGRYTAEDGTLANVVLDPTLFRQFNVTEVPKVVVLDESSLQTGGDRSKLRAEASVRGMVDMYWINDRLKSGARGDLGLRGPVVEIAERDLIEVMQDKVAKIDWDAKADAAAKRFWQKQTFIPLPRATVSDVREFDPTIVVTADITNPENGQVIVPRGTYINPLNLRSFDDALIVFDPNDEAQVQRVEAALPQLKATKQRITLVATEFDTTVDGWDAYKTITDRFDAPVFKLTSDITDRFGITQVPTVVTADNQNKVFLIETLGVSDEDA